MPNRRPAAYLAVLVLTLFSIFLMTPSALARVADASDPCTIVDTSPDTIVIGVTAKRVQFDVGTDCDDDSEDVRWGVQGDLVSTSAHVGWFGACTYEYAGPQVLDCLHHGSAIVNPIGEPVGINPRKGNDMAGEQNIYAHAFVDDNGNGRDDDATDSDSFGTFSLLRQTTFGSSFAATPHSPKRGKTITVAGQIQRANWDTARYEKYGAWVMLQFKPRGGDDFQDVKWVWDNGRTARTTIKATMSGSYRYSYDGTDTLASSVSRSVAISVRSR